MREMIRLFLAVALFSAVSGGILAAIYGATKERIEYQELTFVKGPTIKTIMEGCSNDPLGDRFKLKDGTEERSFFVGIFEGKANTVAFETIGKGYGGPIGVMVSVNLDNDAIVGVGVTTHNETPGVGSRVKSETSFSHQFQGLSIGEPFRVKADGGKVDAVSGATISSRGVCGAVVALGEIYKRLKSDIVEKTREFKG